jgi:hypothetical protein
MSIVKYFEQSETPNSIAPFGVSYQQESLVTHKNTRPGEDVLLTIVFIR